MYIYRKKKSREGGSVMKIFYPSVLSPAVAVTLLCSCCKEDPLRGLPLGMIGIEEPVAIEPFKTPFPAKIDTGADVASIDAENIKLVKRGEENIVVFTIRQRGTGEEHQYKLPLKRRISIVRHGRKPQQRYVVMMTVRIGKVTLTREFSLANRKNFEYQVLIGRNIIAGAAAVDPSRRNLTGAL